MICPNDKAAMHTVTVMSHYDLPVVIDQCPSCGGIWFDRAELYMAKYGEAVKVETVVADSLATHSSLGKSPLFCPRDKTELIRFTDRFFPKDIVLVLCPVCGGIWLNRGDFTKFQTERQERRSKRGTSPSDTKLEAEIKQILETNRTENTVVTIDNLGRFLNTPIDSNILFRNNSTGESSKGNRSMDIVMTILSLILNVITRGRLL